jgi:hypothetical protein
MDSEHPSTFRVVGSPSNFQIDKLRRYPKHLMEREGPQQWARARILQACERLDIPREKWQPRDSLCLPTAAAGKAMVRMDFGPPQFDLMVSSWSEWEETADAAWIECKKRFRKILFEKFLKEYTDVPRMYEPHQENENTPTAPSPLRYEWTARWLCLGESYASIAAGTKYPREQVRKAVKAILKAAGIDGRK